jgi:hypothetical protein
VGQARVTAGPRNRERELPRRTAPAVAVVEQSEEFIVDPVLPQPYLFKEFARAALFDRLASVDASGWQLLPTR